MTAIPASPSKRVYLDAATAAPLHPAAAAALQAAYADGWADPTRLYREGRQARHLIDAATSVFAAELAIPPDSITYFGTGTQAVHAGVLGLAAARRDATIVHSAVEHSAVLKAAEFYAGQHREIGVDRSGVINVTALSAALAEATTPIAVVMAANHEVGTRQPIERVVAIAKQHNAPLFMDASAAAGWVGLPTGADVVAISGRKFGGPPIGVLGVAAGVRWRTSYPHDDSQHGAGTGALSIPQIVAAAAALRACTADRERRALHLSALVDRIRHEVSELDDVVVVGHPTDRLPHIVTFSVLYVAGEALVAELDRRGFAVSSGSACTASTLQPSHVLAAMGAITHGNVRVSLHDGVSGDDVTAFLVALRDVIEELRSDI